MDDITLTLRMVERLFVVGFAGMAILLGYRLFFHMPTEKDHRGSIQLPGVKVVLSRVGPGVFFLVFGSFVLIQSLHEKIDFRKSQANSGSVASESSEHFVGATDNSLQGNPSGQGIEQKRTAVYEQIGELNCALKLLESVKINEISASMRIAYHDAKLAMLRQVWDTAAWGNIELLDTAPDNHKLKSVYNDTSVTCPDV